MDTKAAPRRVWRHRTGELVLGTRTLLMGIVNVTPDSFSDGGRYFDPARAAEHALQLQDEGADLLDFGAESTRPGSDPISADEQLRRLLPVFRRLETRVRVPMSVDTCLSAVACECLEAGAAIVNDVSALRKDRELAAVCARYRAGVVLMHMRGTPDTMQQNTHYDNLLGEVGEDLRAAVSLAEEAGIVRECIVVDPGIGFGKSYEQNYRLLGGLSRFHGLAAGVLAGPSRKGFTGEFSQAPADRRRFSTAAAVALSVLHGADVVRVHDVAQMREVTDIIDRFREIHARADE
ncbi:dihydropteroate synthase [bacterium]|nr:dihydropteroate synthase [bacterium]MBU1985294.1 dihydropteroate synthase [bacterium]